MKYCPNPDCPYAKKHARPGEYVDTASLCTDCGAQLGAAPPVALPPVAAPLIVKPSDANRRLVVTLGAAVALGVLSWLPVVGAPESVFGGSSLQAPMRMLAVGMVPFMSAFTVVELLALMLPGLRAVRVGGTKARATLDRTAWVLGFVLLGVQLFGVDRYLRSSDFAVPPPALLWAQWLLAHLAMLGLAFLVTRSGLGHGLALVMVMSFVQSVVTGMQSLGRSLEAESVSVLSLLIIGGPLIAVAVWAVGLARRERGRAGALPSLVPFPVSGATAWISAGAVVSIPATLAAWFPEAGRLQRLLQSSSTTYTLVMAFVAFDIALALGFLFFRPSAIGAIWKKWVPGVDETGAVVAARALLPRALGLSIGLTVLVPLLLSSLGTVFSVFASGGTLFFVLIIGFVLADIADEWHALRKLGPLVSVWEVQRTAEVEPIASLLGTAGIEVHARSLLLRTTQQFFAPWIPVAILVPVAREAEAKALLASR